MSGKLPPVIDGFTAEQRLFMGWAQVWRIAVARRGAAAAARERPALARADPRFAPLRNVDAWYRRSASSRGTRSI
jgi:putative endopeptidase